MSLLPIVPNVRNCLVPLPEQYPGDRWVMVHLIINTHIQRPMNALTYRLIWNEYLMRWKRSRHLDDEQFQRRIARVDTYITSDNAHDSLREESTIVIQC